MKLDNLLLGVLAFTMAHILTFFQLNGQFLKTDWFRNNEFWVAASGIILSCLLYTSPSPRDRTRSRMPSSA